MRLSTTEDPISAPCRAALQLFVERLLARSVLTDEEQKAVLALEGHPIEVRARQDFVPLGEETFFCCLIASGLVARVGQVKNGQRQITAFHIPGDMADLHSAVRPLGIGGLTALTDTVIVRIPHTAVRALAQRYPALAEAFWRDCILDAAILMQWAINVGRKDARSRLAHVLCEMAVRYAGPGREPLAEYSFPVVQEHLADATAMTSVHVNRSLKALRDDRLATVRQGMVQIHDWVGLMKVGEFDPTYLNADTQPDRQRRLIFN
ncbi:Crp/Fnr family transcriptional regulator [Sphingobium sufflavum]|uniref:Crp/Fnr family transcriptional regulator n=1 Tax=Sphingobium sufflavum TaxID=1129547 RepID=UPI001F2ACDC2|nr:Crp/Fnr family transcriptional regulator [Sphingobium sufflavum]MCE7798118.1 Crp/Fnr family transcriptional regulator [Sphingobium sufflavum]